MRFNMGYFDGYDNLGIAKVGFAFTFLLLHKYGHEKRTDQFYADRYLKAFPALLHDLVPSHGTPHHYASRCYSVRTFDRFLQLFGLVQVEGDDADWMARTKYITRTPLFDALVFCELPAGKT